MHPNETSGTIIGHAIAVHSRLGPGLLENVYKECLYYELNKAGLLIQKEIPVPLVYSGVKLDCGYRADLLVEKEVVIEIKSVECLNEVHLSQILTYLRLGDFRLGLLINFNVVKLKDGIKRVVNKL